ncbi:MAG: DUF177 domain-containing protein [Oscillospiraceae bacterium]|jgi:uncharacterized protein|nr:DUF177 domain-containing protein [Oscillospiraceae bacterium]MCI9579911.1 DUF177 domain-containing protein [Oscillospiraceae bacterium]
MRLDLREVIHTPGAVKAFAFPLDLSQLEFYGQFPIVRPVEVEGRVVNHAGALCLEGAARSQLELVCDRCGQPFTREKTVSLDALLSPDGSEGEEGELLPLENGELDLDEAAATAFVLGMDTKNLCSDDCKGLCAKCGANLNREPCRCRPEVDPRLAALAQLLDDEN